MKKYSIYIFNKTAVIFLGVVSLLICLIWFAKAISFVKFVTENGIEVSKFLSLFLLILPWLLLFIIPISLFIAILVSYNRLIQSNEITILKNSGLTKFAIARPINILTTFCVLFCFAISFYLMPYANKRLRLEQINFRTNYTKLMFNPGTFENLKNMTIYVKSRQGSVLSGILLHDKRSDKYSLTITAQKGNVVIDSDSALLYMEKGSIQKFNHKDNSSEILYFDNYTFNLSEAKASDGAITWKARERYFNELLNPRGNFSKEELQRFNSELHQRITYPLFSIIFAMIAAASMLYGQFNRKGNFSNVIRAIIFVSIFMILTMILYNLIEKAQYYLPFLYLNFAIFFVIANSMLESNYRKK